MSISLNYGEIDSLKIYDLECDHGVPEVLELSGVSEDLVKKLQTAGNFAIAPEEFKSFLTVSLYSPNRGGESENDRLLRIVLDFLPRKFACMKLKNTTVSVMLGEKELRFRLKCRKCAPGERADYTRAMLAIDLGNTRTCALVCPDLDVNIKKLRLQRLELSPHYAQKGCSGVWNSLCVIGKSRNYAKISPSFVRLGPDNDLYLRDGKISSESLRSLSTPKRYFWDIDSNRSWCVIYPEDKDEYLLKDQKDFELVGHIADHYGHKHPRAMMLEGMIFEMLDQAERMLNEENRFLPENRTASSNRAQTTKKRTHIVKLAITYPAAWSAKEVEMYREVIQRGLDCYTSQRCGLVPPIELPAACNEAVAVMVNYIYSETLRFGDGYSWLKLCGKVRQLGDDSYNLRIGVIDIGGGTSDLAITEVTHRSIEDAISISTLYTSGTNEAGDAMMARIIRDIIFDKVLAKLCTGTIDRNDYDLLKDFYGKEVAPKTKSLARSFWFPLAIQFLNQKASQKNGETLSIPVFIPKADDDLSLGFRNLLGTLSGETNAADDERIKYLSAYLIPESELNELKKSIDIVFGAEDMANFQKVLEDNFKSSPRLFGAAISAYQCDLLIWSGKTADNPTIRKLFEDFIPIPPEASISMNDYRISGNFPLTDLNGRLYDSKLATAIGAALYQQLRNDTYLKIQQDTAASRKTFWGRKDAADRFRSLDGKTVEYSGSSPLIIYRAETNTRDAFPLPAYEFRSKPGRNISEVNVSLQLEENDAALDFVPVGGHYLKDGVQKEFLNFGKEDFELRIRMTDEDEIWLDSGNILIPNAGGQK